MIAFTAPCADNRIDFKTYPNRYGVEIDLSVEQLKEALRWLDGRHDVSSVTIKGITISVATPTEIPEGCVVYGGVMDIDEMLAREERDQFYPGVDEE